jgi:hypothetical protein
MRKIDKTQVKETAITQTIGKFTALMVRTIEEVEGEKPDFNYVMSINKACGVLVRRYATIEAKDRFFYHYAWEHRMNGLDYGFGYLAHYIVNLFKDLVAKRYEPVTKKNFSVVMKTAMAMKREGKAKDQSSAMVKAYKRIGRTGTLRTDSIQQECSNISETCLLGLWPGVLPSYPSLNCGMDGKEDNCIPKSKAVILIADITGTLAQILGYQ